MSTPIENPWIGARVLAYTPMFFHGLPTMADIANNIPRVESGVIVSVFRNSVEVLIDGKKRPEFFAWGALHVLPVPKREDVL